MTETPNRKKRMIKLYTIAFVERQCYGHGDYGDEEVIKRMASYGTGDFPPLFDTEAEAEEFRKQFYIYQTRVVCLQYEQKHH